MTPDQDESERQEIAELRQTTEMLKKANRKMAMLCSVARHDILNQVAVLVGYLELLEEDLEDQPDAARTLKIVETAARKIEQEVVFTRAYEKLGAQGAAWQNVGAVARGALGSVKIPERVNAVVATGPLEVYADPLLDTVFFNLFDNAVKHAGSFSELSVSFRQEGDVGIVTVEDNGVGVPDEIKERIFSKGYGTCTGFGLYLAKEILDITGISIREIGTVGSGAQFELCFPPETWRCTSPDAAH